MHLVFKGALQMSRFTLLLLAYGAAEVGAGPRVLELQDVQLQELQW